MTWGVCDLTVTFGDRIALDAVGFETGPTSVTAVVGGDGAGKTTLLRVLAGLPIPHRGIVTVPARQAGTTLAGSRIARSSLGWVKTCPVTAATASSRMKRRSVQYVILYVLSRTSFPGQTPLASR